MTETTKTTKDEKDFAARLADAGGEAMQKLSDLPMGKVLVDGAQQLRERLDELATRIRAIDPLEKRVTVLEERCDCAREEVEACGEPEAGCQEAGRRRRPKSPRGRADVALPAGRRI